MTGGAELASQEGTTQGDPLAMPLYALSLMPLLHELHGTAHHIWYADDAQATGKLAALRKWWDLLASRGPGYGYFVNASKTILVCKPDKKEEATTIFQGTGIKLADGARDLGSVIGTSNYIQNYIAEKVSTFCNEMHLLARVAETSPHAAHAAYVHGMRHRWRFLLRTTPNVSEAFVPLESVIRHKFIPALLGGHTVSDAERLLLSLPGRHGGFAIDNPVLDSEFHHLSSERLSRNLVNQLKQQDHVLVVNREQQDTVRMDIRTENERRHKDFVEELTSSLSSDQCRAMHAAQVKGASFLATTMPLKKYGFSLSKIEFRDHLLMRYRWPIPDLPVTCACGVPFSVDHSQNCHLGGFVNMRHDEVRDLLAMDMKKILKDVETEPRLAPLTGESLQPRSANTRDDARSDIRARGFWCRQQNAFFDIRVFYPHASSYLHRSLPSLFESMEKIKKREYQDRILNIEQGSFTPLVFASTGGMGKEAAIAIKKLALNLSEKKGERLSDILGLLRCRIAFALMRAAHICLRGSRPSKTHHNDEPADLIISEARVLH